MNMLGLWKLEEIQNMMDAKHFIQFDGFQQVPLDPLNKKLERFLSKIVDRHEMRTAYAIITAFKKLKETLNQDSLMLIISFHEL